ncbi:MAG: DNA photolyase family protein [Cytophagales bacterium]|nr:DNA photolyase family protein [Cytophagales bacterium]MDW8383339.1 deoxyribodipyrimidine photo-lyase [Flammeovirgaceae bacterium]
MINVFWFRRDLRLDDNAGLYYALRSSNPVLPIFIFDKHILEKLDDKFDKRLTFIYESLQNLQSELISLGTSLDVRYGTPEEVWKQLIEEYEISDVFTNHDYEPYAIKRDKTIHALLHECGIGFHSYKDQTIFEKNEILKDDGKPYTIFTPYSKKWHQLLATNQKFYLKSYPTEKYFHNFLKISPKPLPPLESFGFQKVKEIRFPSKQLKEDILKNYAEKRDFPSVQGTTRLSVHLRFGTVSIRKLAQKGLELSQKWLTELIWRDFYMMILYHFPHVVERSFQPRYDRIEWRNCPEEFQRWCEGKTGYPIVDAGMRELNETGYMHNRVRMITASFLTKHLLIDWRWGEAYFAKKLLDFDLAANNGGWQWAAGTGCDATPYFRIFNPFEQTKKFDRHLLYIQKWIPELFTEEYPKPIVEHKTARERCLQTYQKAVL